MTTNPNMSGSARRKSPSFGIRSFLFAAVLVFFLYLLASAMARNRFFQGGAQDHRATSQPQP